MLIPYATTCPANIWYAIVESDSVIIAITFIIYFRFLIYIDTRPPTTTHNTVIKHYRVRAGALQTQTPNHPFGVCDQTDTSSHRMNGQQNRVTSVQSRGAHMHQQQQQKYMANKSKSMEDLWPCVVWWPSQVSQTAFRERQ